MANQDRPAFLSQPGAVNPMGGDTKQGPYSDPEFTQGGAPAGRFFSESELPVHATSAGSAATTGGFSPTDANPPLPAPGSDTGFPLPPSGFRR